MGYTARTSAGLALLAAGLTVVEYALFNLIHAGTCLSNADFTAVGGCFDGMPRWYRLIPVGLAVGFLGLLVFRARGAQPAPDGEPATGAAKLGTGVVAWSSAFVATSAMLAFAGAGPNPVDGTAAKRTAIAAAIVLLAVGLLPLLQAARGLAWTGAAPDLAAGSPPTKPAWTPSARPSAWTPTAGPPGPPSPAAPPPSPSAAPQPATPAVGAPAIDRLGALARERDSGAISQEEFERAKAEILAEMSRGL